MSKYPASAEQNCLQIETKDVEALTEERIRKDHRLDNLVLLVYVILLILSVLTIWMFKHRRLRFVHETGLSVIYGLIVGAAMRFGVTQSTTSLLTFQPENATCNLPPEKIILRFSVNNTSEELKESLSYQYAFEGQTFADSPSNDKATFDPEIFFNLLLPPIIFAAGYSMKRHYFFRNIGAIITYAVFGTFFSAFIIAVICYGFTRPISGLKDQLYFSDCVLFGSMISATDPVTILAIFHDLGVDVDLYALVFGESVLNDALAIGLSQSVEKYGSLTDNKTFDSKAMLSAIGNFIGMFSGSFLLGVLVGCCTSLLTKFTHVKDFPLFETTLFVLMSYSSFLLAEAIGFTGIVSVLFCGVIQAHYTYKNLSSESKAWTKQVSLSFTSFTVYNTNDINLTLIKLFYARIIMYGCGIA
ncbi:unnamed protein product [Protopolystoma xenopodis]|uniref:Cation/H+ exchanger transmembrane domain-containing protein n=1 Tax=Protopolystoma xenopodis TaxID=117903 RepID=A0A3S5B2R0_9PLAT|nr:unnamed protein product [Protopolystoma xenopodis]